MRRLFCKEKCEFPLFYSLSVFRKRKKRVKIIIFLKKSKKNSSSESVISSENGVMCETDGCGSCEKENHHQTKARKTQSLFMLTRHFES